MGSWLRRLSYKIGGHYDTISCDLAQVKREVSMYDWRYEAFLSVGLSRTIMKFMTVTRKIRNFGHNCAVI